MNTSKTQDHQLLERIRFHDAEALELMIDHYGAFLFKLAVRIIGDPDLAETILKRVFQEIWNNPLSFSQSHECFFSSYLIKLCKHKSTKMIKKGTKEENKKYVRSI